MKRKDDIKLMVYVPWATENGQQFTMLAVNKLKTMTGVAPTREILETHFAAERVRMQIFMEEHKGEENAKYIPQPLYIETERFAEIAEEVQHKVNATGELQQLSLTLGGQLPCCIIAPLHKEEYEAKEIESKK